MQEADVQVKLNLFSKSNAKTCEVMASEQQNTIS